MTLRCHLQRGDIRVPESRVTRSSVEQNFDVFGFELTDDRAAEITPEPGQRIGPDPDKFDYVR